MTARMPIQLLLQVPYFAGLDQVHQIVLLEGEPCTACTWSRAAG
jgi:hypothetical protein